ncbi:MAG TPA: 6-bladed beta-propeller [Gammaproteobacteria bacterium]|nr:6-bladed beta-propeller [Gammaproteobacteria bacterium]
MHMCLSRKITPTRIHRTLVILALALLTGCAGTPRPDDTGALFFPPPPDLPRLQYLTRFSTPSDVETESMGLRDFIVGEDSLGDHLVRKPFGVAMYDGKIYVADTRGHGYGIFDLKNKRTDLVQGSAGGAMKKPINITIDTDGTKYVTDTDRNQVLVFDVNDRFVRAIGTPDQFKPIDVLIVDDKLYVSDLYHHQIQVLDKAGGETLFTFGKAGSGDGELFQPTSLALGPDHSLYISDTGNFRIQKYSLDGKFIRGYGSVGDAVGHFARPKGIAVDREGRIYIIDAAFENVQILKNDGTPLMFFGKPGDKRGDINLPTEIVIDYDNLEYFQHYAAPGFNLEYVVLIASQFGINKVVAFGFGKMEGLNYDAAPQPAADTEDENKQ